MFSDQSENKIPENDGEYYLDESESYEQHYDETPQEKENRKLFRYFEEFSQKENKVKLTLRLDKDVYDWYKYKGKGYQTKINAALRAVMQIERDKIDGLF